MSLSTPSGLFYLFTTTNQVTLTWYAVAGAVSYNIYNRNDALSSLGNPLNSSPITTLTYTDLTFNGLLDNYYNVVAVDSSGNFSFPSTTLYIPLQTGSQYVMPRIDLFPSAFDKFLLERGYDVIWQSAISCPCNTSSKTTTDSGDVNCTLCSNKHFIWVNPIRIKAAMQSMGRDFNLQEDGIYQLGNYKITTHSSNKIGFYDRLTFLESTAPLSESLIRSSTSNTDATRFPIASINLPIIDRSGNYYTNGPDFTLSAGGQIVWNGPSGRKPQNGMYYGVGYFTCIRLLATEFAHDIRSTHTLLGSSTPVFVELARQTIGRLEWFFDI